MKQIRFITKPRGAPPCPCPICSRSIAYNALGAVDTSNEPVLEFHINPKTGRECACSGRSIAYGRALSGPEAKT